MTPNEASLTFDCDIEVPLPEFDVRWQVRSAAGSLGLYGPSGAGKTTILECVAGWRTPSRGHIALCGETLFDTDSGVDVPPSERRIGYLPQDLLLFPHLDVLGNLQLAPLESRSDRTASDPRLDDLLQLLELGALRERRPHELSGGEKQRVALARALLLRPRVLLLDEPLASLDRPLKRRILSDLLRLRHHFPVPLLLVSHDPAVGFVLCERIQQLERGRVVREGPSSLAPDAESTGATTSSWDLDNLLRGTVSDANSDAAHLDCNGLQVIVPQTGDLAPGAIVSARIPSNDTLVATRAPEFLSAVNSIECELVERVDLPATNSSRDPASGVLLRCRSRRGGLLLEAHVTHGTVDRLQLEPGRTVWVVFKAHAVEILGVVPPQQEAP